MRFREVIDMFNVTKISSSEIRMQIQSIRSRLTVSILLKRTFCYTSSLARPGLFHRRPSVDADYISK